MHELNLNGLPVSIVQSLKPFIEEVLANYQDIHSIHIVGSALTNDFNEKVSDINSIVVLKKMDIGFLESIAPLGKKFRKKAIAAPLIMTPEYIESSLDVFPIEFYNFILIHKTIYGIDIIKDLHIDKTHLRIQCEREIKAKLIWLRQGFISSIGDKRLLSERFSDSITGYIPLFRAIIFLLDKIPPVTNHDVILTLQESVGIDSKIFEKILLLKMKKASISKNELTSLFEDYYMETEKIGSIIDEIKIKEIA